MSHRLFYLVIIAGFCFAVTGFYSCDKSGRRNIRDYYYPALDLQEGKVYAYDMLVNGVSAPDYWYYKSFVRDSGLYMSSTNYNRNYQIDQMVRERIADDGSVARSYLMFEQDSATGKAIQVPARLTRDAALRQHWLTVAGRGAGHAAGNTHPARNGAHRWPSLP